MALTDAQRAQLGAHRRSVDPRRRRDAVGQRSRRLRPVPRRGADRRCPTSATRWTPRWPSVDGLDPAEAIAVLRQDPAGWGVLTAVVPGAYFMNPAIRAAIGYPGLERRPIDPNAEPDYLADGLLDSVVVPRSRLSPHAD